MTTDPQDPNAAELQSTDFPPPPPAGTPAAPPAVYHDSPPPMAMSGQLGKIRGTGSCILLTIVTLGLYPLYWYFQTHEEMKRHSGQGLGGAIALVLGIFVGIAMPYITSSEVGGLYERRGQKPPVTGLTGLWYFPGIFILVGPIVWFVKTNGALNAYWSSLGAGKPS